MGKFVIKKDSYDQYRFNLKAANGEIILSSEAYTTKQNCQKQCPRRQQLSTLNRKRQ